MAEIYWKNFGAISMLENYDPKILNHIQKFTGDFYSESYFDHYYEKYGPFGAEIMSEMNPLLRSLRYIQEKKVFQGEFLDTIVKTYDYGIFHRQIFHYTNDEQKLFLMNNSSNLEIRVDSAKHLSKLGKFEKELKKTLEYVFNNFSDAEYKQKFLDAMTYNNVKGLEDYYYKSLANNFSLRTIRSFINYNNDAGLRVLKHHYNNASEDDRRDIRRFFIDYKNHALMNIVNPDMLEDHIDSTLHIGELIMRNGIIIPNEYMKIDKFNSSWRFLIYAITGKAEFEHELLQLPFSLKKIDELFDNPLKDTKFTLDEPGKYLDVASEFLEHIDMHIGINKMWGMYEKFNEEERNHLKSFVGNLVH